MLDQTIDQKFLSFQRENQMKQTCYEVSTNNNWLVSFFEQMLKIFQKDENAHNEVMSTIIKSLFKETILTKILRESQLDSLSMNKFITDTKEMSLIEVLFLKI